ncbi:MAG: winged helix-turn-helix domain-containing protein [Myxococcota bacterium]
MEKTNHPPSTSTADVLRLDDRIVDLRRRQVWIGGRSVRLTSLETQALSFLAARAGTVVSRNALEREVWGLDPNVLSNAVPEAMRRLRKKLERSPREPTHLHTVRGEGWLLRLPTKGHALIGRDALLVDILSRLDAVEGWLTLTGPPGVGKSALADEILRQRGGVRCDLSTAHDAADAFSAMARALDMVLPEDPALAARELGKVLVAQGHPLLVLDHPEALDEAGFQALHLFTAPLDTVSVLVASRAPPAFGDAVSVPPLATAAARQLLRRRALPNDIDQYPTQELDALVDALDRLPLAIEMAGSRMVLLSPTVILSRLEAASLELKRLAVPSGSRHSSMERTIAWSWDLLDGFAQEMLVSCAILRMPFTIEMAEALSGLPATQAVDALEQLVRQNLIRRDRSGRLHNYRVVRDVVLNQHPVLRDASRKRHMALFSDLARGWYAEFRRHGGIPAALADAADRELPEALATAAAQKAGDDAAIIALALVSFLNHRGPHHQLPETIRLARAAEPTSPMLLKLWAEAVHNPRRADRPTLEDAAQWWDDPLIQTTPTLKATAHIGRGWLLLHRMRAEEATHDFRAALDAIGEWQDDPLVGDALQGLGVSLQYCGSHTEAEEIFLRMRAFYNARGNVYQEAGTLYHLALFHHAGGRYTEALDHAQRAAARYAAAGSMSYYAQSLRWVAVCLIDLDRFTEARTVLEDGWSIAIRCGAMRAQSVLLDIQVLLARRQRRYEDARRFAHQCRQMAVEIGAPQSVLVCDANIAMIVWAQGQTADAARRFSALVSQFEHRSPVLADSCRAALACCLLEQGDVDRAGALLGDPQIENAKARALHRIATIWLAAARRARPHDALAALTRDALIQIVHRDDDVGTALQRARVWAAR